MPTKWVRFTLVLLALILLFQEGSGALVGVFHWLLSPLVSAGSWSAAALFVAGLLFGIGLLVRLAEWAHRRDTQAWRRGLAARERARLSCRRPAEDVPVVDVGQSAMADPDPPLRFGDG